MSKKTDIVIVGVLSTVLFTGFTVYSHFTGKGKRPAAVANPAAVTEPAVGKPVGTPSISVVQSSQDQQTPPADPAPPAPTRNKNTKTKAS